VTWVAALAGGCRTNSNLESREIGALEITGDLGSWVANDLRRGWGKIELPAGFIPQEGEVSDAV